MKPLRAALPFSGATEKKVGVDTAGEPEGPYIYVEKHTFLGTKI